MIDSISYKDEESKLISEKMESDQFNSESWADDDLSGVKKSIKSHYLKAQNNTCPYCRQKIKSNNGRYWDIEHIIPRSANDRFMFEPKNLCMACIDCNIAKSDKKVSSSTAKHKYPSKSSQFYIVHPHIDDYNENILVIKPGLYYVPKGKKGEKTIEVCRLNRFYEFADYGEDVQDDDRIFLLSEMLTKAKSEDSKRKIRKEIAELAIRGAI